MIIYLNSKVKVIFIQWQNDQFWKFISTLILFSLSCNKIFLQSLTTVNIRHTSCSISLCVCFFSHNDLSGPASKAAYLFSLCFMTFLSKVLKTRDSSSRGIHNIFCIKTKNDLNSWPCSPKESRYCSLSIPWWNSSSGVLKCTKAQFHVDGKIFKNSVKTSLSPRNILSHKFQLHSLKG